MNKAQKIVLSLGLPIGSFLIFMSIASELHDSLSTVFVIGVIANLYIIYKLWGDKK